MKKCPFCAEDIQETALECRRCRELIQSLPMHQAGGQAQAGQTAWYYSTTSLVVAFFCVGPFMLPLIWKHPTMSQKEKYIYGGLIAMISLLLVILAGKALSAISEYYKMVFSL